MRWLHVPYTCDTMFMGQRKCRNRAKQVLAYAKLWVHVTGHITYLTSKSWCCAAARERKRLLKSAVHIRGDPGHGTSRENGPAPWSDSGAEVTMRVSTAQLMYAHE